MRWIGIASSGFLVCLVASNAMAGRIFGDIKMNGKPVAAGLAVTVALAPTPGAPDGGPKAKPVAVDSTVTDKFGSYKLSVKGEGKCILTLLYEKQSIALEVFFYKNATRYDLILEKKDGTLSLRRK